MVLVSRKIESFRDRLVRWLEKAGETPATIAPKIGVSFQAVYLWLDGSHLPPRTRVDHLAAALGISPKKLAQVIDRERPPRKHRSDGGTRTIDATGASVVVEANEVLP